MTGAAGDAGGARPGRARDVALVAASLAVWLWTTFAHAWGTELSTEYFQWARRPGSLREDGGLAGVRTAELLLAAGLAAFVVVALALAIRRLRGLEPAERRERLVAWALWLAVVHLLWKTSVVYATELVHFAQYGVIGALLAAGLRGGRRPDAAFLVTTALGVLDEAWQHWGIAIWIEGSQWHAFDWSDCVLNAAGACGGALIFAPVPRASDGRPEGGRAVLRASAALAALLLPLLLLDRVTLTRLLGSVNDHPTWNEFENGKPVHWWTPVEGIPLFVASVPLLGLLLAEGRTYLTRGVALGLLLLVSVSIDPPSFQEGRPLHEVVPEVAAGRAAPGRIVADGVLDEPEWERAARVGPFGACFSGVHVRSWAGDLDGPFPATHARVLWDDRALHVAFECEDRDVWARRTVRDDERLPGDEVVEVFLDPDGDEATYYEIEVSPLGVVYDLFNWVPAPPGDLNPRAPYAGLAAWDARGLAAGVRVDGTLDAVGDWSPERPIDEDRGWTAEVSIPWDVLRTTTTPSEESRVRLPPRPGDRWRLGLFRVERPRVARDDGRVLGRNEARDRTQFLAWSPTFEKSFHRPARFGVLVFAE